MVLVTLMGREDEYYVSMSRRNNQKIKFSVFRDTFPILILKCLISSYERPYGPQLSGYATWSRVCKFIPLVFFTKVLIQV